MREAMCLEARHPAPQAAVSFLRLMVVYFGLSRKCHASMRICEGCARNGGVRWR